MLTLLGTLSALALVLLLWQALAYIILLVRPALGYTTAKGMAVYPTLVVATTVLLVSIT